MICRCLNAEGETVALVSPAAFRLCRDAGAPADSLELTVSHTGLPAAAKVELMNKTVCWFRGIVDEQNEEISAAGSKTELICRSFEAVLLDNPAAAGTVQNPSCAVMEYWQLRPLGVETCRGPAGIFRGAYTAAQGVSVYTVLKAFSDRYGTGAVWMPDEKTVSLEPAAPRHWQVERIQAVKKLRCPYKRISEVAAQNSVSGCYHAVTANRAAQQAGIVRRRYLQAAAVQTAQEIIDAGERAAFSVEITAAGILPVRPGDRVSADLGAGGTLHNALVRRVVCRRTAAGCTTTLRLLGGCSAEKKKEETECG